MLNDQNQHFALRKLSVGLASVLIGISFVGTANRVKADTVQSNASQNNVVQNDQGIKNNNDNSLQTVHSDPEQSQSLQTVQEHVVVQSSVQKQSAPVTQSVQSQAKDIQSASKQVTVPDSSLREVKFDSVAQRDYLKRLRNDKVSDVDSTVSPRNESKLLDTAAYNQSFAYAPDISVRQSHKYTINQHLPNGQIKTYTYNVNLTGTQSPSTDVWTWTLDPDWEFSDSGAGILHINKKQGSLLDLGVAGYSIKLPFSNVSPHDQNWFSLVYSANSMPMNVYSGDSKSYFAYFTYYYNMDNVTGLQNKIDHFIHLSDSQMHDLWPKDSTVDLYYQPNPQSIKYVFADDDDNGKEVLTKTVNGVTDQTVNTNLALPTNYVLAPNNTIPSTVKLSAVNNPVVIHVKHAVQDTTMTDPNAAKKTVYRVVELMPNSHNKTVAEIDVTSRKIATKDLVTGKTTYSDNYVYDKSSINAVIRNDANTTDPTEILDAPIDQIPGYTISMHESLSNLRDSKGNNMLRFFSRKDGTYILDFVVGDGHKATYKNPPESQDFYINYVPTKQQVTLNYYDSDDHDKLVKSETVTGDYNSTIEITPTDTDNYYFDPDRSHSSEYHVGFTKANKPVAIYLKHKTNDTYDFDTSNRDIIVNLPNGVKHEYWQEIGFRRTKTVDLVTKKAAYGDWNVFDQTSSWRIDQTLQKSKPYIIKNGAVRFAPINLPNVPGYTPIFKWLNSRAMQINLVKD